MWALWASGPSMKYDHKSGSGQILHWCCSCEPCGPLGLSFRNDRFWATWVIIDSRDYMIHDSWFMTHDYLNMTLSHETWFLNFDSRFIILESWFIILESWIMILNSWFMILDSWLWPLLKEAHKPTHSIVSWFMEHGAILSFELWRKKY